MSLIEKQRIGSFLCKTARCRLQKISWFPLTIILLLWPGGFQLHGFNAEVSVDEFVAHLNKLVPRLLKRHGVPGASLSLVRAGELVWSGAYGYADLEHQRPMTVDSICRVESISKSVTAWGVMRLVEKGLIDLDEPAQKYLKTLDLPRFSQSAREITVRRLLSGNAGLPLGTIGQSVEYPPGDGMPSLRDYLTDEIRLIREPGSGFSYSNAGYNLLELLIEEVTGRDFSSYMADEVLAPLGMERSSFSWDERFRPAMPMGYELNGAPVPPYVYPARASGGLLATADDIARFIRAGLTGVPVDNGVLNPDIIRQIHTPQVEIRGLYGLVAEGYGFGHFIETLSDGREAVWHGGQGHGWMSHFHAVPQSGDGIVILTNSQRSWPFIAEVLNSWSRWQGFKPVKMGRMAGAGKALWALIVAVGLSSLYQAYRLAAGLRNGSRRLAPLSPKSRIRRAIRFSFGIGVMSALAWSAAQPYLFIMSVFPVASIWAGYSLLVLAMINVVSACCPRLEPRNAGPQASGDLSGRA
ncbi:MAG: serine hydrolase domain-containing protein [Candidatus Saccharicenans sp.]|nr:serine hydrolase domain-containing protein [Candidatus Saccharicenans sp.]